MPICAYPSGDVLARRIVSNSNPISLPENDAVALWEIPLLLSRTDAVLRQAIDSLELASVAKHAHVLAQAFNSFYHRAPVAREDDPETRRARAAVTRLYLDGMTHLLSLMGIEVPDRM